MQKKIFTFHPLFATLVLLGAFGLSCKFISYAPIRINDPRIGTEFTDTDNLLTETTMIDASVSKIFLEFFLDIPENSEISLVFNWYYQDQLVVTYSGKHGRGYTVATLERDLMNVPRFLVGDYKVEVWYLNTMLASKPFSVR